MTSAATARPRARKPSLRVERTLQRQGYPVLAGMDEVGRGALAGPVSVGVVLIDESSRTAPVGVKDSKLLAPAAREQLVPRIQRWSRAHAVGHAWPNEIDAIGIIAALRLAGRRALGQLQVTPDLVILDGNHDWLTDPMEVGLLALTRERSTPPVTTMIKADGRDGAQPRGIRLGAQQGVCRAGAPRRPRRARTLRLPSALVAPARLG